MFPNSFFTAVLEVYILVYDKKKSPNRVVFVMHISTIGRVYVIVSEFNIFDETCILNCKGWIINSMIPKSFHCNK